VKRDWVTALSAARLLLYHPSALSEARIQRRVCMRDARRAFDKAV